MPEDGGRPHAGLLSGQVEQVELPGANRQGAVDKEMLCRSEFTRSGLRS